MRVAMAAASAALAAWGAGPALAEGFTVIDLGGTRDRETCLYRATRAMERYRDERGLYEFSAGDWIVFAYDLGPGDNDVTIMCPILGPGEGFVNAFLNVHGEGTTEEREAAADAIESYWNE